jgi:hypothetical protein
LTTAESHIALEEMQTEAGIRMIARRISRMDARRQFGKLWR